MVISPFSSREDMGFWCWPYILCINKYNNGMLRYRTIGIELVNNKFIKNRNLKCKCYILKL